MKNAISEFFAFAMIIVAGYALWAVTPAHADGFDDCKARYAQQTLEGISARVRCLEDAPDYASFSDGDKRSIAYTKKLLQRGGYTVGEITNMGRRFTANNNQQAQIEDSARRSAYQQGLSALIRGDVVSICKNVSGVGTQCVRYGGQPIYRGW